MSRTRTTSKSYCRFCHAYCAIEVDVEDGRVVGVRGDASDPVYQGYTCLKGRELPAQHNSPDRLLHSQKRLPDGRFVSISTAQALDEIAETLRELIERHGPRAVATYCGTHAFQNAGVVEVARGWHEGIGSPSFYSSMTIDQPAKLIARSRLGVWSAGPNRFDEADVALVIGNNTLVSVYAPLGGIPPCNPSKRLRDAQRRGLVLIVVDPRRTEVARRADLFLQVRPGEDATLLAGFLQVIFRESLHDEDFCADHVEGLAELREAVRDFEPDYVEARAGVPAALVEEAARTFAGGKRGAATTGTGPDMGPRPNLVEHLVLSLNSVCGRWSREGDRISPGLLRRDVPRTAQAVPTRPAWGSGPASRVRALGQVFGEMPTAALADEILEPGEGQVRALLTIGGNPVVAWPDQLKTIQALRTLELHVSVDITMSASAKLADYVIAPKLSLEREDVTLLMDAWYVEPYAHYTRAVVEPPGDDLIEEWQLYTELARRLGSPIRLPGGELDLSRTPTKLELLEKVIPAPRVQLAELRAREGGHLYEEGWKIVGPPDPALEAKLAVGPPDVIGELREVRAEPFGEGAGYRGLGEFTHRLICRRLKHVYNSSGRDLERLRAKGATNLAYMHPDDVAALGLASGELVEIRSERAAIVGVVESSDEIRPGVISMAHAFGDTPEHDAAVREIGATTSRLVDNARDFDPITGMAVQSAIPVNVHRLDQLAPISQAAGSRRRRRGEPAPIQPQRSRR